MFSVKRTDGPAGLHCGLELAAGLVELLCNRSVHGCALLGAGLTLNLLLTLLTSLNCGGSTQSE